MPKNTTIQNSPHQIVSVEEKPIITVTPEQIIKAANGAVVLSIGRCVELVGGTIKQKTFFNLLSQGNAPRRLKVGRRTCFDTAEFAEWFCRRLTVDEAGTKKIPKDKAGTSNRCTNDNIKPAGS